MIQGLLKKVKKELKALGLSFFASTSIVKWLSYQWKIIMNSV